METGNSEVKSSSGMPRGFIFISRQNGEDGIRVQCSLDDINSNGVLRAFWKRQAVQFKPSKGAQGLAGGI